jgi:hypothetical protein
MGILNYTTEIAVGKTIGEIGEMLRLHGASDVMVSYDTDRNPTRVQFMIRTEWGPRPFSLPANSEGVYKVLVQQSNAGKVPRRFATMDQAHRVAWRIVREWLASQLAMIEAGLVSIEQTLLAYMTVKGDQTLYQVLDEGQLKLPQVNGGRFMLPSPEPREE